jgi:hypothetical protein
VNLTSVHGSSFPRDQRWFTHSIHKLTTTYTTVQKAQWLASVANAKCDGHAVNTFNVPPLMHLDAFFGIGLSRQQPPTPLHKINLKKNIYIYVLHTKVEMKTS